METWEPVPGDRSPPTADRYPLAAALARIQMHLSALDAQTLLTHLTGKNRAWVLAHPEAELLPTQLQALEKALIRLQAGEPLPYILGRWAFYGLDFRVTPATLIPRPETELLVEQALQAIGRWQMADRGWRMVDIGTGTGCIAITLAVHIPELQVIASDISAEALQIARANARRHGVDGWFVQGDLLTWHVCQADYQSAPHGAFNLITANLPYIPTGTLHQLDVYGREPSLALDGGPDGLDLIRRLLPQAARSLAPGGLLLLEIEATHGASALMLARAHFPTAEITLLPDLAGRDRLLQVQL